MAGEQWGTLRWRWLTLIVRLVLGRLISLSYQVVDVVSSALLPNLIMMFSHKISSFWLIKLLCFLKTWLNLPEDHDWLVAQGCVGAVLFRSAIKVKGQVLHDFALTGWSVRRIRIKQLVVNQHRWSVDYYRNSVHLNSLKWCCHTVMQCHCQYPRRDGWPPVYVDVS